MGGRPPKAAAQHKLDGTFQKCRHADRGTNLKAVLAIDCPKEITGEARANWNTIVPDLCKAGLITIADLPSLKDAFTAYGIAQELLHKVEEAGGAANYLLQWEPGTKDFLFEARRYMDAYERIMLKYGITPVERAKIRGAKKEDENDDSAVKGIIGNG